jgi:glycosyltransferase involved in cell wall biosynthesis
MPIERISTIITTYNRANIVVDAISSVLSQTHPVDELILVDDGSTDDTEYCVKNLFETANINCRYIKKENGGMASALIRGIEEATGNWIAFLDDDDLWSTTHIERCLKIAEKFSNSGCICGLREEEGKLQTPPLAFLADYDEHFLDGRILIRKKRPLIRPFFTPVVGTSLIKRDLFQEVTFSPKAKARLDIHFFWRLSQITDIALDMSPHGIARQFRISYLSTDSDAPQEIKDNVTLKRNSDEIAMLELLVSETSLPKNHIFITLLYNARIGRPYLLRQMGLFNKAIKEVPIDLLTTIPLKVLKEYILCIFRIR